MTSAGSLTSLPSASVCLPMQIRSQSLILLSMSPALWPLLLFHFFFPTNNIRLTEVTGLTPQSHHHSQVQRFPLVPTPLRLCPQQTCFSRGSVAQPPPGWLPHTSLHRHLIAFH